MFPERSESVEGGDAGPLDAALAASASDDHLVARSLELERLRVALDAEQAVVLAELAMRGTCDREFGLGTAAWIARDACLPIGVAKARLRVANKLRSTLPLVADALAAGTIGIDHAQVLAELANPRIADVVAENQALLIGLADRCRFEQWRNEVRALGRLWDQDGGYDPDEDPSANRVSYGRTLDGLFSMAVTLTGENAAVVEQAVESMTDTMFRQAVVDEKACPELVLPSRSTLRARALVELVRRGLAVDLDATIGPKVEATLVVDADEPTSASDPDGVPLADGTTRVLQCDAELHPLVVDGLGVPLDLGGGVRLANRAQRRATRRRDGGCTFPGCHARVMWCDVHHCVHADGGGVTDICNLVCLCRSHHGVVHRTGWSVRVDADGWAIFTPPNGRSFWGQRHGRQREGPPPERQRPDPRPPGGREVVLGRYRRTEDPLDTALTRQIMLRRLARPGAPVA